MWHYFLKAKEKGFRKSLRLLAKVISDLVSIRYDKIEILWFRNILSHKAFFRRIDLRLQGLKEVRAALEHREFDKVKILFVDYLRKREVPRFFLNHEGRKGLLKIINEKYRGSKEATIRRANEICEHNFQFLVPDLRFADKVDWVSNLIDDRRWEIRYWRDIDYSSAKRIGDVRQIWELNRHQYFVTLGKAYWFTEDEKYAKEFVSQIRGWVEKNPYGKSVNWVHAQEVALRIISWIWGYFFFCNSSNFTVEDQIEFFKSLYLQTEFLRKHLSDTTFSTHNHIISEATGLAMMAIMFPEFKRSKLWWRDGVERLEKELKRQICKDGVSGETSTNYHFFVLDSFLQIYVLLDKNGRPYDSEMKRMLEKMVEFSMHICRPDGTLPIIGDSDSGRGIRLDDLNGDDRRSYLSTGAALFDRPDMKSVAGKFYEESLWLLGLEGYKKFMQLSSTSPPNLSKLYPDSGFCIMRNNWSDKASQLIFRGGAVNTPKDVSIGHNHADYLSFELAIEGKPIIIDPGVYTYNLEDKWRWYGRKTSTHNTVVVDGQDQFAVDMQRFGLPRIAKSQVHTFKHTDSIDVVDISHDGYSNGENGVLHRRKISFGCEDRVWVITDTLTGNGRHQFDWYFHFNNEIDCDIIDELCILARDEEGIRLELRPLDTSNLCLEMNEGWISKKYGEKRKAKVARYSSTQDCPTALTFQISYC